MPVQPTISAAADTATLLPDDRGKIDEEKDHREESVADDMRRWREIRSSDGCT